MNVVISENINIISHWLLYIFIWFIFFIFFKRSRIFLLLLFTVKSFKLIFITVITYIFLVLENKTFLNSYSKYLLHNYFKTTTDIYKEKPCIYITNYPVPFLNYFICSVFPEKTVFIGHYGTFFGANLLSKYTYTLKRKKNFKTLQKKINTFVKKEKKSVVLFVEEIHLEKKSIHKLCRLKNGIFEIAKHLRIPVVPVGIQPINTVVGIPLSCNHKIISEKPFFVENIDICKLKTEGFFNKFLHYYT